MTPGEQQREQIFNKYADNLQLLANMGIVGKQYEKSRVYICPMCLTEFLNANDPNNPLTLEDAPPKALGGKAHILTCKRCNNTAGTKIDSHLVERLREIDKMEFKPGTESKILIKIGDEIFRSTIRVDDQGKMTVEHSNKNNHPEKLAIAMKTLKAGSIVDPEFRSKVIPENLQYALLKSGYLLLFKKYGYNLILDPCYDIIRAQLQNPENPIYPQGFWFRFSNDKIKPGEYFMMDKGIEGMLVVFNVSTDHETYTFGTILPLPIRPVGEVIKQISEHFEKEKTLLITLYPQEPENSDYLKNTGNISSLKKWLDNRR